MIYQCNFKAIIKHIRSILLLCFLLIIQFQLSAQPDFVFNDPKFVTTDTLELDFDGVYFTGSFDVKNSTEKKDKTHTWLFSKNLTLNSLNKNRAYIDRDMNAIKMRNSFQDLYIQVQPDFNKPAEVVVKASLSHDTVYKGILKYPIISFDLIDYNSPSKSSIDTVITGVLKNNGLEELDVLIKAFGEGWACSFDSLVHVEPLNEKEVIFAINNHNSENGGFLKIEAINTKIPLNRVEKFVQFIPIVHNQSIGKEPNNFWWIWVLMVIGVLGFVVYLFKTCNPFLNKTEQQSDHPLEIRNAEKSLGDLIKRYRAKGNVLEDDDLQCFIEEINQLKKVNKTIDKEIKQPVKVKKPKVALEFKRKDIVQRSMMRKYINDQGLHQRLQRLSEVELVKYIHTKFKDSVSLQRILAIDPGFTANNIVQNIRALQKRIEILENKQSQVQLSKQTKAKTIVVNKEEPKLKKRHIVPVDDYVLLLNNLGGLLKDVVDLDWGKSQQLLLLKNKFLGYLGIKENRLSDYISQIIHDGGLCKDVMYDEEINRFIHLFTDLFNLQSFIQIQEFYTAFKSIDFPIKAYEELLQDINTYLSEKLNIQLIIPKIFVEHFNENLHQDTDDVSKILAENVIEVSDFIERGIIKDYSRIGVKSDAYKIYRKAHVYLAR